MAGRGVNVLRAADAAIKVTGSLVRSGRLPSLPPGLSYEIPAEALVASPENVLNVVASQPSWNVVRANPRTKSTLIGGLTKFAPIALSFLFGPEIAVGAIAGLGASEGLAGSKKEREIPTEPVATLYVRNTLPEPQQFFGGPMFEELDSFATDFGDFFSELVPEGGVDLSGIGDFFQSNAGTFLDIGSQALQAYAMPVATRMPAPRAPAPGPGVIPRVAGGTVGRAFFNKYPNLAAGIQALRNRGINMTRGKLWGLMRRFGPQFLITAGILTAQAIYELAMAGPGRRHMNAANGKALRRAARRIKSFHKLCQHTDLIKPRRRTVTVGGRCGTCRKSPCRC